MSDCFRIIAALEEHASRINKEQILEAEAVSDNTELFAGMRMALDALITFGVRQVPVKKDTDPQTSPTGLHWDAFVLQVQALIDRRATGHAARDLVEHLMFCSTVQQWNGWYRRILIKDLRCGVSEKTVNKVLKVFPGIAPVPVFECQLAHDGANHEKKIAGKKILQPKLDGVRCLTVVDYANRTVTQFSRNGKELVNFGHITTAILDNIDALGRSYVLDGEIVSNNFQDLMKQVHRKDDVQAEDAKLMLFDIVPLSEFRRGQSVLGQGRRLNLLNSLRPVFDVIGHVELVPWQEVDLDDYIGQMIFKQYMIDAVKNGFEGIMIKDTDAPYECKRSHAWLKQKPFIEVSLEITDVEEGTGRNAGRLGALVCSGMDDGRSIRVNVGSGFSDADRDEFWSGRDSLAGQVVEVRADAVTQNQDGTYSLRFPRFLKFRGFRAGEKL
jgi:DNA ligase-1